MDLLVGPRFVHPERAPQPLAYVVAIDVSYGAQQSGLTGAALQSLASVLQRLPDNMPLRLALLTFSDHVHCYDVTSGEVPKMYVVHDGTPAGDAGKSKVRFHFLKKKKKKRKKNSRALCRRLLGKRRVALRRGVEP